EEEGEGQEAHEVDAPCYLVAAEETRQPWEARGKRRRHREPGEDLKRRQPEDEKEVRELLECVVTVGAGGGAKARVRNERIPCRRNDRPRGGPQPPPLRGCEDRRHVDDSAEHPAGDRPEMPVAPQAQVVAAGQREPGRERLGLVLRGPERVVRHLLPRETDPLTPGRAVVAPVEFRV